ncbi:MAG: SCO family protein [Alphaproteobacteria bacterium]|nr:SCO family protein [Alphaproteobacteria bacterium]
MSSFLVRLVFAISVVLPVSAPLAGSVDELSGFAFQPHPGARLPLAAEFVDEQAHWVRLDQFFSGRPVVLVLDYLRCRTLCGLTLGNLVAALDALPLDAGRDFQVVVIDIDPRDKPADVEAAKVKYLAGYHHPVAKDGWHFLTGQENMIRTVADAVGFPYRYEAALDQYIHPAGFVLAAGDGSISRYLLGVDIGSSDLRTAITAAAQGKAQGLVQRILLLCHGKDPNLGRHSLAIEAAFIVANLMAMAGGVVVFVMIRRRSRG